MKTEYEILEILRQEVKADGSVTKWSKKHNVHVSTVSSILTGHLKMSPTIACALGYRRRYMYEKTNA